MKCILALADEEGRRGAAPLGRVWLKMKLREGRLWRCSSTAWNPGSCLCGLRGWPPNCQYSPPKSIWGRGGSKGNVTKIPPLRKKARWHRLATAKRNRGQGGWELLLEAGQGLEYSSTTCPFFPFESKLPASDEAKPSWFLLTGQEAMCCPGLGRRVVACW